VAQREVAVMRGVASLLNLPPGNVVRTGIVFEGVASWYGPGLHGHETTNGERFDAFFAHTAAHRELPFGTWLLVTRGERSLMVRVIDRGPFHGDRFLDLSFAGARALGIEGTARVSAEICVAGP
jgi:rare lipoprotein A